MMPRFVDSYKSKSPPHHPPPRKAHVLTHWYGLAERPLVGPLAWEGVFVSRGCVPPRAVRPRKTRRQPRIRKSHQERVLRAAAPLFPSETHTVPTDASVALADKSPDTETAGS